MKEVVLTLMAGRAYVFSLLHKMLGAEPTKTLMDAVSSEESMQAVALFESEDSDAAKKLGNVLLACRGMDEERLDRVREEYTRLFIGPDKLIAAPWESVYTTKERALFQESTLAVRGWYQNYGYELAQAPNYPDDHISPMLHFLALTTERAAACVRDDVLCGYRNMLEGQKLFEQNHILNWVHQYAEDMDKSRTKLLYPQLVRVMADFMAYDQQLVKELLKAAD
ncbi:MAG: molecular chaperone TorD family protein [Clostridia bacterium]|nr:molecular chaperone TorD family protein [Clostridia bacterium]